MVHDLPGRALEQTATKALQSSISRCGSTSCKRLLHGWVLLLLHPAVIVCGLQGSGSPFAEPLSAAGALLPATHPLWSLEPAHPQRSFCSWGCCALHGASWVWHQSAGQV